MNDTLVHPSGLQITCTIVCATAAFGASAREAADEVMGILAAFVYALAYRSDADSDLRAYDGVTLYDINGQPVGSVRVDSYYAPYAR